MHQCSCHSTSLDYHYDLPVSGILVCAMTVMCIGCGMSRIYDVGQPTQIHIKVSMVTCPHEVGQGTNAHLVPQHIVECAEALLDVMS